MSSFKRRDALISIEQDVRELWETAKPFEIEAPIRTQEADDEHFYVTFPFPYMNGRLHLGHAFSMTKAEYSARFKRLQGKRVLWPFGFHCTGMPIAACADKLRNELADALDSKASTEADCVVEEEVDITKEKLFGSKKSKALAKTGNAKTQTEILLGIGVPAEEIPLFQDAQHWLKYFPPLGKSDLINFGVSADWRRSFITTDANPYFDKFVQWQYRTLLKRDRIKFGLRPAVFSRVDNQPCADHDRAAGEGANPQEYTMLKLRVNKIPIEWLSESPQLADKNVFLVAATLRPETMYGQTNCFVLPDGEYILTPAFPRQLTMDEIVEGQKGYVATKLMTREEVQAQIDTFYICSDRSASNMGFQGIIPMEPSETYATPHVIRTLRGRDLLGLSLSAPLAVHAEIFALPMPSIKMDKGTGIVTSVPSDSADDYAMLKDLQDKEKLRAEFGIAMEWTQKSIVEVLEIPGLGRQAAVTMCQQKKVASWKDEAKLKEIKQEVYQKGFYEGVLVIGNYSGKFVRDAKDLVKRDLIEAGMAVAYREPERKVVSRSGDDCVVALCNQWYSDFGEPKWKAAVRAHVASEASFETYGQRHAYLAAVDWIEGWACSRNYGLGTLLPWEAEQGNRVLIESLSDSTIHFAYYCLSHFWQGDMYGQTSGIMGITPDQLTDAVFDYVFAQTDAIPNADGISSDLLQEMRETFEYWYPMSLRVSGKDLVRNHLTMSLFHHAAIWPHRPDLWPRGFFVNGHLLLDAEKMSKSTGNFLTVTDSLAQYGADATRLALADAGDSVDDANFERQTANGCIMRLFNLVQYVEEVMKGELREGEKTEVDRMFENEIIEIVKKSEEAFDTLMLRDALKYSFYEMISLKDTYKNLLPPNSEVHRQSIMLWIETIALVMSPIACFTAEHIWTRLLQKPSLIVKESWPVFAREFDAVLHRKFTLLLEFAEDARRSLDKACGKKKQEPRPDGCTVYVARRYQPWQERVLNILQQLEYDPKTMQPLNSKYIDLVKDDEDLKGKMDPKQFKLALGFASYQVKEEVKLRGFSALSTEMPFDEFEFLKSQEEFLLRNIGLKEIQWCRAEEVQHKESALPGKPAYTFFVCP